MLYGVNSSLLVIPSGAPFTAGLSCQFHLLVDKMNTFQRLTAVLHQHVHSYVHRIWAQTDETSYRVPFLGPNSDTFLNLSTAIAL